MTETASTAFLLVAGIPVAHFRFGSPELIWLIAGQPGKQHNIGICVFHRSTHNSAKTFRKWNPKAAAGDLADDGFLPASGAVLPGVGHGDLWLPDLETGELDAFRRQTASEDGSLAVQASEAAIRRGHNQLAATRARDSKPQVLQDLLPAVHHP